MWRKRNFALEQAILWICKRMPFPVWVNLTFAENLTDHAEAVRRWKNLLQRIKRVYPGWRCVGVWARQERGAWHIHAVSDRWLTVGLLRKLALECGFGPQMKLKPIGRRDGFRDGKDAKQVARYISQYCGGKNALDEVRDRGVRRLIYVGTGARKCTLRFNWAGGMGALWKRGRMIWSEICPEPQDWECSEKRKRNTEDWKAWYERTYDFLCTLGFESLSPDAKDAVLLGSRKVRDWWRRLGEPECPF